MQTTLLFISSMDVGSAVVRQNCTWNYTKRIYERLGFDTLGEIKFAVIKTAMANTGKPKSFKMYGKITSNKIDILTGIPFFFSFCFFGKNLYLSRLKYLMFWDDTIDLNNA